MRSFITAKEILENPNIIKYVQTSIILNIY